MKKFKIITLNKTRLDNESINLDLISQGIYNNIIPKLYHNDKKLSDIKHDIIHFHRNNSSPTYFSDIKEKLNWNLEKLYFTDVELFFPTEDLNIMVFNIIQKFNIPNIGDAEIDDKILILDDKVYFKRFNIKMSNYIRVIILSKEFILSNNKFFKQIA